MAIRPRKMRVVAARKASWRNDWLGVSCLASPEQSVLIFRFLHAMAFLARWHMDDTNPAKGNEFQRVDWEGIFEEPYPVISNCSLTPLHVLRYLWLKIVADYRLPISDNIWRFDTYLPKHLLEVDSSLPRKCPANNDTSESYNSLPQKPQLYHMTLFSAATPAISHS
jgi:hypothetical protein